MRNKLRFSGLAKKTLAGTLALSMVMSMNLLANANSNDEQKGEITAQDEDAAASYNSLGRFTLEEDAEGNGIKRLNDDVNGAEYDAESKSWTFHNMDDPDARGIEVTNLFDGKTELNETLLEALQTTNLTFAGLTFREVDTAATEDTEATYYHRVADKGPTKEAALEYYAASLLTQMVQYDHRQIWAYAESVTVPAVKFVDAEGKDVTSFVDGTSYNLVSAEGNMTLAEYIWRQAQDDQKLYGSTWASLSNFKKAYVNTTGMVDNDESTCTITTENVIKWSKDNLSAETDYNEVNALGHTFQEEFPNTDTSIVDVIDQTPDTYTFPYPTWTKGAAISFWVKMPAKEVVTGDAAEVTGDAAETPAEPAPVILEINGDRNSTLYMKADGTVKFTAGSNSTAEERNMFKAVFSGDTPMKKAGEWVYVTLAIKNDDIDVYYNGVKATERMDIGSGNPVATANQYFNYGTGYGDAAIEDRIKWAVDSHSYDNLLKKFGDSTEGWDDMTKYTFNGSDDADYLTMMGLLTKSNMSIYLGGGNRISESAHDGALSEGMSFRVVELFDTYMTAESAKAIFDQENAIWNPVVNTDEPVTDLPNTSAPVTDLPNTPTPGTSVPNTPTPGTNAPNTPAPGTNEPSQPTQTPDASEKPVVLGDVTGDGEVTLDDARAILQVALAINPDFTGDALKAADVNGDGKVDLEDANIVLRLALGIPVPK